MTETTPRRKIVCLDFDGVLHRYGNGWKGVDVIDDEPNEGAMAFLAGLLGKSDEFEVHIFSSRSGHPNGIEAMKRWVTTHLLAAIGSTFDRETIENLVAREIEWPTTKPPAHLTIDDRAIRFEGAWPTLEWIRNFEPWNAAKQQKEPRLPDFEAVVMPDSGKIYLFINEDEDDEQVFILNDVIELQSKIEEILQPFRVAHHMMKVREEEGGISNV